MEAAPACRLNRIFSWWHRLHGTVEATLEGSKKKCSSCVRKSNSPQDTKDSRCSGSAQNPQNWLPLTGEERVKKVHASEASNVGSPVHGFVLPYLGFCSPTLMQKIRPESFLAIALKDRVCYQQRMPKSHIMGDRYFWAVWRYEP